MRTYRWEQLTTDQRNTARRLRDDLAGQGWGITVSQLAKHFDQAMAWRRGEITAEALAGLCSGAVRIEQAEGT